MSFRIRIGRQRDGKEIFEDYSFLSVSYGYICIRRIISIY